MCSLVPEQEAIRLSKLVNIVAKKTAAPQSDQVEADKVRSISHRRTIGDDIGIYSGHSADHSMRTDAHILMDGGTRRQGLRNRQCLHDHRPPHD